MSSSHISYMINQWSYSINQISLVGALEHFYLPYIGNNHPNWLSHFSEELKPPSRNVWGTIHLFLLKSFYCKFKKLLIKWIKLQLLMLCLINPTIPQLLINSQHSPIVDVWGTIPAFFRRFSRPTCLVASDSPCLRAAFASRPLGRSLISTTVWPVI